jgi:hypothetical protein
MGIAYKVIDYEYAVGDEVEEELAAQGEHYQGVVLKQRVAVIHLHI